MIVNLLNRILHWVKLLFSGSDEAGIKRVSGFIIIIAVLVLLYFVGMAVIPISIWKEISSFCEFLVITASLFFGVNAIIDVVKIVKGKPGGSAP